jgi:hypothetical protein
MDGTSVSEAQLTVVKWSSQSFTGYVHRITHVEIADTIGYNLREVLGTPANLNPKGGGNNR